MEGFLSKMEEGEGLKGKIALHPLPLDAEQGRGRWAPAVALVGGPGHGGGRDQGEKGEGEEGVRFPYSPRAEVVCGGRATVAGGGGRLWPWRRRCRLGEGASGGGDGCGGRELRGGPLYRPGEAVEARVRRCPAWHALKRR